MKFSDCTAYAGAAHFERFVRHDIPSGISIELDVRSTNCDGDGGASSSHEHFAPRRTMPVSARSLLQRTAARPSAKRQVTEEPPSRAPLRLEQLVDPPHFTFIDCQKPLFLRNHILHSSVVCHEKQWQHIWWHASTYHALWHTPDLADEVVRGVTFYVDGSALRASSRGAAGAVMLVHTDSDLRWAGFATAPCLGESTAPRAEATALLLALC